MEIVLDVTGMTCGGCAASVTKSIQRVDASAQVDVDLKSGRVRIEGNVTLDQAVGAVEDAGFGAAPHG